MGAVKFLTVAELKMLAHMGRAVGYNRQLEKKQVEKLIADQDPLTRFPILMAMTHKHIAGEEVEPHKRIIFTTGGSGMIQLDIPMPAWEALNFVELDGHGTADLDKAQKVEPDAAR